MRNLTEINLPQAEAELSDQAKRDELDAVMFEARAQALKAASLPTGISDTDPRVLELVPSLRDQVRARAKDMLIEEERMCSRFFSPIATNNSDLFLASSSTKVSIII